MADKPIIEINRNTEGQLDGLCKFYFHSNVGGKLNWRAHFKEGKLHGQSCYFCKDKKNSEQYFEYRKPG